MTKIYIYCLFDHGDNFHGVYSSLKAVHRDAIKLCNKGTSPVFMQVENEYVAPSLTLLRNLFKGEIDVKVSYISNKKSAKILKTKLTE